MLSFKFAVLEPPGSLGCDLDYDDSECRVWQNGSNMALGIRGRALSSAMPSGPPRADTRLMIPVSAFSVAALSA
jgi:hypothetical protein